MKQTRPNIPQVEKILGTPEVSIWFDRISRPIVVDIVREQLDGFRGEWRRTKTDPPESEIIDSITSRCLQQYRERPIGVINCSGVLIHTNLGRSPIDIGVWNAVCESNTGYVALEYDLDVGKRGNRNSLLTPLFNHLTGAGSAVVVNNNAAALFLILSVYAKRREVIVSRGELVQIGGGFRIPDILKQSGAKLVEVGTTNITTIEDYLDAITDRTALVLKVHRSNFAIRGFSKSPSTKELAAAIPSPTMLVVDQGSGVIDTTLKGEESVRQHLEAGAHIVSFSADKVLGSAQAGCIVGEPAFTTPLAKSPLYRVLRPGKTVLTLLEQTLVNKLNGKPGFPLRMGMRNKEELWELGRAIIKDLPKEVCSLTTAPMTLGGGSTPDEYIEGVAIRITLPASPDQMAKALRDMVPPIIGQIEKNGVLLHLGAVETHQAKIISESLERLVGVDATCT